MSLTEHYVTSGSTAIVTCPECDSPRAEIPLVAVTDEGPVTIGLTTQCECHEGECVFRCAFCVEVLISEGNIIFRHMLQDHDD